MATGLKNSPAALKSLLGVGQLGYRLDALLGYTLVGMVRDGGADIDEFARGLQPGPGEGDGQSLTGAVQ
ncbi:MAG: hypothetical protein H8E53_10715 [Planctomycetes bacterium]|nr:hypothetical protein [Planctomycetota bacterium]